MVLQVDWAFNDAHTDLDERGTLATGARTLADWAATVAVTPQGGLPEDPLFGAGLGDRIADGLSPGQDVGEQLRGALYGDERVADVDTNATTTAGRLVLPVRIEPAADPGRWSGPLSLDLIEQIIAEHEDDVRGEAA